MICPNCGHEYKTGSQCPQCKLDTVLFNGTVRISDILYNKGLARAKTNDLSGAIESLTKSVHFNKNNVLARNLLGLTLYEIGHVGDALKHWVVSQSLVKEDNPAAVYIDEAQKSGRSLERMNDAVRMYNQALEYIRQASDDMAIIQLKKAVEINPKFVDAQNLLALCFLIQRDREHAALAVERVLSMDVNNTVALYYYNELCPNRMRPDLRTRKATPVTPTTSTASAVPSYQRLPIREKKTTNFHIAEILSFIIGAACMFAALYVLVLPALTRENDSKVNDAIAQLNTVKQESAAQLAEKDGIISERDSRIDELENAAIELERLFGIQERTNRVLNAYGMLTDNKLQEAVDIIGDVDTNGLASDIIEKAEAVYVIAYPRLAQNYYNDGVQADKDKDYDKSLVDFEKSLRYVDDEASFMPDLLYYLGVLYAKDEEKTEAALQFLQKLAEEYPKYKRINEVNKLINTLNEA